VRRHGDDGAIGIEADHGRQVAGGEAIGEVERCGDGRGGGEIDSLELERPLAVTEPGEGALATIIGNDSLQKSSTAPKNTPPSLRDMAVSLEHVEELSRK
jgi:hypothetical protein